MADEETQEEQPKRRRRRGKASESEEASASSAPASSAADSGATGSDASASDADDSSDADVSVVDEVEPTAADEEAEEAAADVVLEAEAEVDEDSEVEGPEAEADEKPKRGRGRKAAGEAEEPAAPKAAPTRRRAPQRDPSLPPPVVRAQAKYVRSSARKARLVCDHIRGKSVDEARAILAHTPRAVARDWSKLLESAIANAENNHELVAEDLYVKTVHADEGPTIKRFRPRAMGRATRIRKRTSHLTILLTPKD
jgi:ribosomal protein L22